MKDYNKKSLISIALVCISIIILLLFPSVKYMIFACIFNIVLCIASIVLASISKKEITNTNQKGKKLSIFTMTLAIIMIVVCCFEMLGTTMIDNPEFNATACAQDNLLTNCKLGDDGIVTCKYADKEIKCFEENVKSSLYEK